MSFEEVVCLLSELLSRSFYSWLRSASNRHRVFQQNDESRDELSLFLYFEGLVYLNNSFFAQIQLLYLKILFLGIFGVSKDDNSKGLEGKGPCSGTKREGTPS